MLNRCASISPMDGEFIRLAAEFETLQNELERTNDPALRRAFLIAIRSKLELIQGLAASPDSADVSVAFPHSPKMCAQK